MPKVEVFLKPHEIEYINKACKGLNLSRSAWIRKAVLEKKGE